MRKVVDIEDWDREERVEKKEERKRDKISGRKGKNEGRRKTKR